MEINQIIGLNLKKLRTEKNRSLGQLAEASGISKGMLSQIENGDTNPTINTIWKICAGLNVPYTSLLEPQVQPDTQVMTKKNTLVQISDEGTYRVYCYYTDTPSRNFELFQMELDEGAEYTSVGHSKKSDEYIMVLEGQLTLKIDEQILGLNADDATTFNANRKHIYKNTGRGTLKTSIINYYQE